MTDTNARAPREEDFPPSRPGPKTLIGAAIVVLIGIGVMYWPAISSFIHFQQIRDAMSL